MTSFKRVELQSISKIIQGGRHKLSSSHFVTDGGFPAYGAGGLNGYLPKAEFDCDAVVLSSVGARCGKCFFATGKWSSLANTQVILPDERQVDPLFLWYQLNDEKRWPRAGVAQPFIKPSEVKRHEVLLPLLHEQKRIAAILDQADELRRKRQRALNRLNQLGQAIFHEMFGDSTSNPKGWREDSLGSIVRKGDKINYGVVQPGDDVEHGVPLIRVGDLFKPVIDASKTKRISSEIEANYKRSRLIGDEILIGCVGSIGTVALAHAGLKGANIARAVARVPVNSGVAEREFVAEMIRSPLVQRYFAAETRTVAQPTLNIGLIVGAPILIPPLDLQKEFVARISALRAARAGNGKSAIFLDGLFSSLQHRAFRGEL